jgi:hypothetical protein
MVVGESGDVALAAEYALALVNFSYNIVGIKMIKDLS